MSWAILGTITPTFETQDIEGFFIGPESIRVEHFFNGELFPGLAYAVIQNVFANGETSFIRRSYPVKNFQRVYEIDIPTPLLESGYILYQLQLRINVRARIDVSANWQIRISQWIDDDPIDPSIDGDDLDSFPTVIFDGDL
jgi:hypothetical protein